MLIVGVRLHTHHLCSHVWAKLHRFTVLTPHRTFSTFPMFRGGITGAPRQQQQLTDSRFSTVNSNSTGPSPGLAGGSICVKFAICTYPTEPNRCGGAARTVL